MTRTRWITIIVATIIIVGGIIALASRTGLDVSKVNANAIIPANTKAGDDTIAIGDHVYGNTSGKVMLVEYGDFQCPYCGQLHPVLEPILDYYKDSLTFVFRNFPLTTAHPNALAAATAAEAAGLQGSDNYWKYNNKLYDVQSDWDSLSASQRTDVFVGYAKNLGLNPTTFRNDLTNPKVSSKISFDMALGNKINVNSTPTLVLQGQNVATATGNAVGGDATVLENDIRAALKQAGLTYPDKTYAQAHSS